MLNGILKWSFKGMEVEFKIIIWKRERLYIELIFIRKIKYINCNEVICIVEYICINLFCWCNEILNIIGIIKLFLELDLFVFLILLLDLDVLEKLILK